MLELSQKLFSSPLKCFLLELWLCSCTGVNPAYSGCWPAGICKWLFPSFGIFGRGPSPASGGVTSAMAYFKGTLETEMMPAWPTNCLEAMFDFWGIKNLLKLWFTSLYAGPLPEAPIWGKPTPRPSPSGFPALPMKPLEPKVVGWDSGYAPPYWVRPWPIAPATWFPIPMVTEAASMACCTVQNGSYQYDGTYWDPNWFGGPGPKSGVVWGGRSAPNAPICAIN